MKIMRILFYALLFASFSSCSFPERNYMKEEIAKKYNIKDLDKDHPLKEISPGHYITVDTGFYEGDVLYKRIYFQWEVPGHCNYYITSYVEPISYRETRPDVFKVIIDSSCHTPIIQFKITEVSIFDYFHIADCSNDCIKEDLENYILNYVEQVVIRCNKDIAQSIEEYTKITPSH